MVKPPSDLSRFESFVKIVEGLRGPDGCPWDKEQTHQTLTPYAIEEAHELAEAIEQGSTADMVGELGDLLLQVVLHAEIGRQAGTFTLEDVIRTVNEKMVRRHPHVFGEETVTSSTEVLNNWAKIKAAEKAQKQAGVPQGPTKSLRFDVPLSLPALSRAHKIGDKTQKQHFDWTAAEDVLGKVDEEMNELKHEFNQSPRDRSRLEHELGDVLFSVSQLGRHLGLESEQCLRQANARFEKRFFTMREMVKAKGLDWDLLTNDERESAWVEVKRVLHAEE